MSSKAFSPRRSNYRFNNVNTRRSPITYTAVGSYADAMQASVPTPPAEVSAPEPAKTEAGGNSYADIMANKGMSSKTETEGVSSTETVNKAADVSELCLTMSSMDVSTSTPKAKKSCSSIESIHSPKAAQKPDVQKKPDEQKLDKPKEVEKAVPMVTPPKPNKSSSVESIHSAKTTQQPDEQKVAKPDEHKVTKPMAVVENAIPVEKTAEKPTAPRSESVLYAPAEKKVEKYYGGWKGLKGDPEKLERLNKPRAKPLESRWAC